MKIILTDGQLLTIPTDKVFPSKRNPRKRRDGVADRELAASIAECGILQPLLVRSVDGGYDLVSGHRRFDAAVSIGLEGVPCLVRVMTDAQADDARLVENLQRENLAPIDEALGIAARMRVRGETLESVAQALGKPIGFVARRARLAKKLAPSLMKALSKPDHVLREWGADRLELLALVAPNVQEDLVQRYWNEVPKVAALRATIAEETTLLKAAPWDLDDADLVPKAGACSTCPNSTAVARGLFDEIESSASKKTAGAPRCLDQICWFSKLGALMSLKYADAADKHDGLVTVDGEFDHSSNGFSPPKSIPDPIGRYGYERGKKSDKGSVPAFIVSGKGAGRIIWIKKPGSSARTSSGKKPAAAKVAPGTAADLKKKEGNLEKRRAAFIVDSFVESLRPQNPDTPLLFKDAPTLESMMTIIGLLGAYGIDEMVGYPSLKERRAVVEDLGLRKVWEQLRPKIAAGVRRQSGGNVIALRDEVQWLRLILFSQSAVTHWVRKAEEEIPEPKALSSLRKRREGSGKTPAKKATPKKAAKRKATKRKATKRKASKKKAGAKK